MSKRPASSHNDSSGGKKAIGENDISSTTDDAAGAMPSVSGQTGGGGGALDVRVISQHNTDTVDRPLALQTLTFTFKITKPWELSAGNIMIPAGMISPHFLFNQYTSNEALVSPYRTNFSDMVALLNIINERGTSGGIDSQSYPWWRIPHWSYKLSRMNLFGQEVVTTSGTTAVKISAGSSMRQQRLMVISSPKTKFCHVNAPLYGSDGVSAFNYYLPGPATWGTTNAGKNNTWLQLRCTAPTYPNMIAHRYCYDNDNADLTAMIRAVTPMAPFVTDANNKVQPNIAEFQVISTRYEDTCVYHDICDDFEYHGSLKDWYAFKTDSPINIREANKNDATGTAGIFKDSGTVNRVTWGTETTNVANANKVWPSGMLKPTNTMRNQTYDHMLREDINEHEHSHQTDFHFFMLPKITLAGGDVLTHVLEGDITYEMTFEISRYPVPYEQPSSTFGQFAGVQQSAWRYGPTKDGVNLLPLATCITGAYNRMLC